MNTLLRGLTISLFTFGALANSQIAFAQDTPTKSKPILVVSGKINAPDKSDSVQFDREALEALGTVVIETNTPWFKGVVKFEGVRLDKVMEAVGASGESVLAVALNDYGSEIPISDFAKFNVILALKRDGEYMPVRDKGPLFIVYPYDQIPELKSAKYYTRSVWQVGKLIVK